MFDNFADIKITKINNYKMHLNLNSYLITCCNDPTSFMYIYLKKA